MKRRSLRIAGAALMFPLALSACGDEAETKGFPGTAPVPVRFDEAAIVMVEPSECEISVTNEGFRDGVQYVEFTATCDDVASDPRLSGQRTSDVVRRDFGDGGTIVAEVVTENAGGRWVGTFQGTWREVDGAEHYAGEMRAIGEGGYDGLTVHFYVSDAMTVGWIVSEG